MRTFKDFWRRLSQGGKEAVISIVISLLAIILSLANIIFVLLAL